MLKIGVAKPKTVTISDVPMTKSTMTLTYGEMGIDPPPIECGMTSATDARVKLFAGMQSLIKLCVDKAEAIKDIIH